MKNEILKPNEIQRKILTIRDKQVMLDSDLARFYGVETRALNQAVKRNINRFPLEFMFQLTENEYDFLRSQNVILKKDVLRAQNGTLENRRGKHRKYLPYVFTEQGVAMLSAVLKSETAVEMSVQIMNAFVAMRHFLSENEQVFRRLDSLEKWRTDTDKFLSSFKNNEINEAIFFDGQVFDSYKFACDIIRKAKKSIVLIDNFIDDTVLEMLAKRGRSTKAVIYTKHISKQLKLDLEKHNRQYPPIGIKEFHLSHDRFIIIDDEDVYLIGASLKDLGKKWFAVIKLEKETANTLLNKMRDFE